MKEWEKSIGASPGTRYTRLPMILLNYLNIRILFKVPIIKPNISAAACKSLCNQYRRRYRDPPGLPGQTISSGPNAGGGCRRFDEAS